MIHDFHDKALEKFWRTGQSPKVPGGICAVLKRKLVMLHNACELEDMKHPPGNRLEALKGDLSGQHSIRVNRQWRLVFFWNQGVHKLKLIDYHE